MHGLELEPAVHEIEVGGAVDVHGGAQLALRKGLGVAEVGGRHAPVREGDLDVQGHGDDVRHEHKGNAQGPGGDAAPEQAIPKKEPVAAHKSNLHRPSPGCGAEVCATAREQMAPGKDVEIEAGDAHYRVVGVGLVGDGEGGELVEEVGEVVVGGVEGAQEGGRGGEERDVLDVWVVLGVVGDEVVDVVAAFPPADGEAAAEVGDEDTDEGVGNEVVGDASVAGVVGREHDLMLLGVRWKMEYQFDSLPRTSQERQRRSYTIRNVGR